MSVENLDIIDKHVSSDVIVSNIKSAAMVLSLSGQIARLNQRCCQLLPGIREGTSFTDFCDEQGVFGSLKQMVRHAKAVSGLHPCRLNTKKSVTQDSHLGFFSLLRSRITNKPVALLLQVDDRKLERQSRLLSLDKGLDERLMALRHFHRDGIHDPLTGLKNRRYMNSFLKMECDLIKRQSVTGSLVVIDIDYFKRVNDIYGHTMGDKVIKEVAKIIAARIRESDIACRWGGEEFVLFLHNTSGHQAVSLCEELRTLIQSQGIISSANSVKVTVSLGVSSLQANDIPETVFSRADQALYQAKKQGRNQVQVAG